MVSRIHPPPYSEPPLPSLAATAPPLFSAPPPRPAASVTSGRSHTRRHRHARTHHGGSSVHQAQNEFPIFSHTGDVEIIITSLSGRKENKYLLHRLILSQCSGVFEAGTRVEWSLGAGGGALPSINENESMTVGSSSRASSREGRGSYELPGKRRWRYVLDWEHAGEDEAPMLVQRDEEAPSLFGGEGKGQERSSRNKPPPANEGFFRSMANFSALNLNERTHSTTISEPGDEVLKDYDNLFRTMYQYPPILDSINIANAYTECKALLDLADMYDALEIVGSRVDHHLLRFGGKLLKQIAKYPPSYLKLGYLARSRSIFTEALIHVVGQWPAAAPQLRNQVDDSVMDLILDKVDELSEQQEKVEFRLWRLNLTTSRGDRVTPSNDYLSWLAISLFRQWLADNSTPDTTTTSSTGHQQPTRGTSRSSNHIASQRPDPTQQQQVQSTPSPGRIYRLLGSPAGTTSYLAHDELKRFLKLQPDLYTRDNLRKFERRMEDVKALAREAVKPLMRNCLELDLSSFAGGGLGYLTCVRVEEREIPWGE